MLRLFVLGSVALAMAQGASLDLSSVRDLELPDQYGAHDTLRAHEGRVVVAMVVSAKRLRSLKSWEEALRERFEGVDYLRVADVATDSPTTYERVATKLKERVPDGVPILIDLERRWFEALDLDTEEPNLLIVDPSGNLVAHYRGRRDPIRIELVSRKLSRLMGAS